MTRWLSIVLLGFIPLVVGAQVWPNIDQYFCQVPNGGLMPSASRQPFCSGPTFIQHGQGPREKIDVPRTPQEQRNLDRLNPKLRDPIALVGCDKITYCGETVELSCQPERDGGVTYYNNKTAELVMMCGGACGLHDPANAKLCKACPPKEFQACTLPPLRLEKPKR